MVEINDRKLPVGIQSFEEIRKQGCLYVDKTDIIWQLANRGKKYNYLSRPRRFGKSVLVDTLEAYFMGKKELFEGLKIMQLETEWVKRPVIRLDMSQAGAVPESVRSYLDDVFNTLETEYRIVVRQDSSLAVRFKNIIETAYNKTGLQVAILIDEYDSPLQHSWKTPHHEACTAIYREVFAVLKSQDKYEKLNFRMWFKYGLKAQKLLAQGIALGIMAISKAPCKGKSFVYCQVFESFCPYRATGLRP